MRKTDKLAGYKDYDRLVKACFILLDNIKNRYPEEKRTSWRCPDFKRIAKLINFE